MAGGGEVRGHAEAREHVRAERRAARAARRAAARSRPARRSRGRPRAATASRGRTPTTARARTRTSTSARRTAVAASHFGSADESSVRTSSMPGQRGQRDARRARRRRRRTRRASRSPARRPRPSRALAISPLRLAGDGYLTRVRDMDGVAQVRSFNRTVTERIGALVDSYLGRGRPLGASRVLWELDAPTDVRELRAAARAGLRLHEPAAAHAGGRRAGDRRRRRHRPARPHGPAHARGRGRARAARRAQRCARRSPC